jgi:CBS domain-containing protein
MNVKSILLRKGHAVESVPVQATLDEAARLLSAKGIGALLVRAPQGDVAGIISERDIVHAIAVQGASSLDDPVGAHMTRDVIYCRPEDTVNDAMHQMTKRRIRHLPVRDELGSLCGLISIGDVVKHRLEEIELEVDQLRSYVLDTH